MRLNLSHRVDVVLDTWLVLDKLVARGALHPVEISHLQTFKSSLVHLFLLLIAHLELRHSFLGQFFVFDLFAILGRSTVLVALFVEVLLFGERVRQSLLPCLFSFELFEKRFFHALLLELNVLVLFGHDVVPLLLLLARAVLILIRWGSIIASVSANWNWPWQIISLCRLIANCRVSVCNSAVSPAVVHRGKRVALHNSFLH